MNEIKLINYDEKLPMLKEIVKNSGSKSVKSSFSFVGLLKYRGANLKVLAIENVGFLAFVVCKSHINIYEFAITKEEQRKADTVGIPRSSSPFWNHFTWKDGKTSIPNLFLTVIHGH